MHGIASSHFPYPALKLGCFRRSKSILITFSCVKLLFTPPFCYDLTKKKQVAYLPKSATLLVTEPTTHKAEAQVQTTCATNVLRTTVGLFLSLED